ncbi:MAG TPA: TonB family protein [Terracidiphilus sp.]|nr:TonB family protein [Terracidiphilus sp.]
MESLIEGDEGLDRQLAPEGVAAPAMGSLLLHGAMLGAVVLYILVGGLFRPKVWGSAGPGGVMQVAIASALPLPSHHEQNQNVLATQTPSEAPAPPAPKTTREVDQNAIPILGKHVKPEKKTVERTQPHQPTPKQQDKARYGEQAGTLMPESMPEHGLNGPTQIDNGNFGAMYPGYVQAINNLMAQNWYKSAVNPATPRGSRVFLSFTINRDGSITGERIAQTSNSSTLDYSCLQAVERVQNFPPLPAGYNQSTLRVSYYCEY